MYYRLKDKYNLRGWELLPYAIVDSKAHRAHFVDKTSFDALTLCDGSIDFDLPLIPQEVRDSTRELAEQGYIEPCSPGAGINQADISKLENSSRNPSLNMLKKLAQGLRFTLKIEFVPTAKA